MPESTRVTRIVAFTVELMTNETGLRSGSGSRPKVLPPGEYFIDMFQSSLPVAAGGTESVRFLRISAGTMANIRHSARFALINFFVRPPRLAGSASALAKDAEKTSHRYNSAFTATRHPLLSRFIRAKSNGSIDLALNRSIPP